MKANQLLTATIVGVVGIISVALFIGGTNPKTGAPDPITVDGQTINFTWTDEKSGENMDIWTDKMTYTDGLSSADVYVAVVNRTGIEQDIQLLGYFKSNKEQIKDISVLTTVTRQVDTPVMETTCADVQSTTTKGTVNVCTASQTGTTTEFITENKWASLDTIPRTSLEQAKELTELQTLSRKSVDGYVAPVKSSPFTVPDGGVVYYKVAINFPANSDGNFFLEAIGSAGGYAHLDPWYSTSWSNRVAVNVVPTKVGSSSAITNFPVYVDLSTLPATFFSLASSTGADIRVTKSDGTSEVAFELVSYNSAAKTGELHFLADSLGTTSTSTFYLYYGNATATAYANSATYGRNNTWLNAGFAAVYHLSSTTDSTGVYDMTNIGSVTYASGTIGNAISVQSAGQYFISSTSLGFTNATTPTFSMFFKMNSETTSDRDILNLTVTGATGADWRTVYEYNAGSRRVRSYRNPQTTFSDISGNVADGNWKYFKYTWVSGANGTKTSINNGTEALGNSSGTVSESNANQFTIGSTQQYSHTAPIQGFIDEVRVSTSTRPLAWSITEYNNMTSNSTFLSIGSQEALTVTLVPTTIIRGGTAISGGGIIK